MCAKAGIGESRTIAPIASARKMRITVSHNKSIEDAKRKVEFTVEQLTTIKLPVAVEVSHVEKQWNGSTLEFSFNAAMGPFRSLIRGSATVTAKDVIIEINLPKLLAGSSAEQALESTIRGLLDS